jgi:hypothetical protein
VLLVAIYKVHETVLEQATATSAQQTTHVPLLYVSYLLVNTVGLLECSADYDVRPRRAARRADTSLLLQASEQRLVR